MPHIGIDTNVFEHLLNPEKNVDSHINRLLGALIKGSYGLLIDDTRKIASEYSQRISPIIRNANETTPWLPLLRHWMSLEIRHVVEVDRTSDLMRKIKGVIVEVSEHADRTFVYVVCCADATLVTNDCAHILKRRGSLLRETRKLRGSNTDFQSSQDAAVKFCNDA